MRSAALAIGLWFVASLAHAQVQQGSFKLSVDTDVFNFASITRENKDLDVKATTRLTSFGPGGSALTSQLPGFVGLALGYVANPHVVPQMHLAFTYGTGEQELESGSNSRTDDLPTLTSLLLRPELEIPFNPDSSVVGYGLVGFDYRHIGQSQNGEDGDPDTSTSTNAFGPALGVGLHLFVGTASIDLAAQYSYLIVKQKVEIDGEEDRNNDDLDMSASILSLTAGLSLWR